MRVSETVLVVALPPYEHAHRAAKIARSYVKRSATAYLALSAAGRSAPRGTAGRCNRGGIAITHVRSRPASDRYGALTPFVNLAFSYLPAMVRLALAVLREPADVVHVNGPYLLPLGLMHKWRYHSILVGNGRTSKERPAQPICQFAPQAVRVSDDADRGAARGPRHHCDGSAPHHSRARLPLPQPRGRAQCARAWDAWRLCPPPSVTADDPVVFATASSIFEGRCFEMLIEACALLTEQNARIKVRVAGYGRPAYVSSLESLVHDLGVGAMIEFTGPVATDHVHTVYAHAHVSSLYEPRFRHNDWLPNKVLECVSFGRPVLATGQPDVVAFSEVHRNRMAGLLVADRHCACDGDHRGQPSQRGHLPSGSGPKMSRLGRCRGQLGARVRARDGFRRARSGS